MHQFQFAGYYAAKEQGYYAAEGLDVEIFERSPDKDVIQQVISGERNFAVGDSGIVSYYSNGEPIVALAAIFQHNPLVFVSKQSSGIVSPYEMKGKRVMFDLVGAGDSTLRTMLLNAGLTEKNYTAIKQNFRNEDFINDKIDVMSAYLSNEIFHFQQKNIKINIINPQNYGVDFYGDILFTSQKEFLTHQERTEKFRRATLKGWQYALNHSEELVQLIHEKYHSKHSIEHLRFEAEETRKLILADVIPLGQIDTERLRRVAEVYAQLNLSKPLSEKKLIQFVGHANRANDKQLIVGSEQDFPPFVLEKTDATVDGFTVELWRAVAEEAQLKSSIRVLPWNQVLDEFKAEKIDVLINFAIHDNRRLIADFSVPHVTASEALFVRKDDSSILSEADLINKNFIIVKGDFALEHLQEKKWGREIISVDTPEEGLQSLASGQHDAMLTSKIVGRQILDKLNIDNVKVLPLNVGLAQKFAFAVHKGDAELLAKINEALAILKANGTYDELYEKWFGVYEEKELLPFIIKYVALVTCIFLVVLTFVFYRRHVERKKSEEQLHVLSVAIEQSPASVLITDLDANLLYVNPSFTEVTGYSAEEVLGKNPKILQSGLTTRETYDELWDTLEKGKNWHGHLINRRKNGEIYWEEALIAPVKNSAGITKQYVAVKLDITERKQTETELRIAAIAFESQEGIAVTDSNQSIIRVNQAFTDITGYTSKEVLGKSPKLLQSGRHDKQFYSDLWEYIKNTGTWSGEIWNRRKNGEIYPEYVTITAVKDTNNVITNYVAIFSDITVLRANADEIEKLAFYDPLTQLPNRRLFNDRLKQALASSRRNVSSGGVLFIDMDNFKNLNDTLGHEMGDLLLIHVADRLLCCVRENDTVARLGGDEFVVLLEDLETEMLAAAKQVEIVGEKILLSLGQLYSLKTHQYRSTPSIGAALFNNESQSAAKVLQQADIAMYQSKAAGRNSLHFFNPEMQQAITARETLKKELHQAVEEGQFRLYYQSQVHQNVGVIGAEALIRWQHPQQGLVSPDVFIPLAEESNLILSIGDWVLKTACDQLKIWADSEITQHLQLAVNISPCQFRHPDFVDNAIRIINESGINPKVLKFEVTESMAIDNLKNTIDKINLLREIGVQFSMDDFGTGHSSLSNLKKLPIEQLKIDQSFVRDISIDVDDAVIVQTIIAMAKNMNLKIIAEGVETKEQVAFLKQHGCEHFQGYLFSKPLPIEQFERLYQSFGLTDFNLWSDS